jgi:hypothetical protein
LRLGLLADFGDAGAVLLLLNFATHGLWMFVLCCVVCGFVLQRGCPFVLKIVRDGAFGTFLRERWRPG